MGNNPASTRTRTDAASVLDVLDVFSVDIAGRRLAFSSTARVVEFSYDEQENKSAEAKIRIVASEGEHLSDLGPIAKGQNIKVRWGYLGQLSDSIEMKIHGVDPKYDKGYEVTITARDHGHQMSHFKKHTVYSNTQLGQVVQVLCRSYGVSVVLPRNPTTTAPAPGTTTFEQVGTLPGFPPAGSTPAASQVSIRDVVNAPAEAKLLQETVSLAQAGRSDRALLHWIAHRCGCEMHFEGKTLKFLPIPYATAPVHRFRWRNGNGTLISFSVKAKESGSRQGAARGVTACGMDPFTKQAFAFTAKDGNRPGRATLGKTAPFGGPNNDGKLAVKENLRVVGTLPGFPQGSVQDLGPVPAPADGPSASSGAASEKHGHTVPTPSGKGTEAERNANAAFAHAEGGGITATAQILGIPFLRRRQVAEITGLEPADCGDWMINAATHKIDDKGYTVSMQLKRHGHHAQKKQPITKGKPNESKPGDPTKKPIAAYRVDRITGQIIGNTVIRQ